MQTIDPQDLFLEVGLKAVENAKTIITTYYNKELDVEKKADLSPVTIADKKAEDIIISTIKENFPDHGFIGEESGLTTRRKYMWVIDPIDGTKNFIRKIPFFGIQLALLEDEEVILGISCCPPLNENLYAQKGKGAYLNGLKISVSSITNSEDSFVTYGGIKHFTKIMKENQLMKLCAKVSRDRGFGDFYMYHLLASGRCDIALEAKIHFWDIAALSIIIHEAGGKITDLQGKAINESSTSTLATNGKLHKEILEHFKT